MAGVSHMTVSRVFSGKGNVSEETRSRIMQAAGKLKYRPNIMASALRGGRTYSVGVLWSLGRPGAEGSVREISLKLINRQYVTYMMDCLSEPTILENMLTTYARRGVEAIIMMADQDLYAEPKIARHFDKFQAVVLISDIKPKMDFVPPVDVVYRDPADTTCQIVDRMVAAGKRSLKLAGEEISNREKVEPFRQRLRHHGLSTDDMLIDVGPYQAAVRTFTQYYKAYDAYFATHPMCDGIMAVADGGAAAAAVWMHDHGVAVPDRVALASFGNTDITLATQPALTAVEWHDMAMVDATVDLLLSRLEGEDELLPSRVTPIPMEVIWRASTGVV